MDTSDTITFKEWFDRWMGFHHSEHATLRETINILLTERDKALKVQAEELARRLDTLNHAHEQAQENFARYAQKEALIALEIRVNKVERDMTPSTMFDQSNGQIDSKFNELSKEIQLLREEHKKDEGIASRSSEVKVDSKFYLALVISVFFSLAGLIISLIVNLTK